MPKKLTQDQFIQKLIETHGNKYDYSKVQYINAHTKVEIICPKHGSFLARPHNLIHNKSGCPQCKHEKFSQEYKKRKITPPGRNPKDNQWFINKAKEVHGDKYDYSKVNYINARTKVEIICPEHGPFWQRPNNHMKGNGCPTCAKEKQAFSTEEFIEKAKKIHGNKYDYSNTKYINAFTKVEIICPKHGSFWQSPVSHLNNQGCKKCAYENLSNKYRMTTEEFIIKAKKIHGDTYDYSKVNYINSHTKVEIICPKHGSFWQTPNSHLSGNKCKKCSIEINSAKYNIGTKGFIERARLIHGDKYDYSKVNYIHSKEKVEIICPKHGSFWQKPNNHLMGHGCKRCFSKISKPEQEIADWIRNELGYTVIQSYRKWSPNNKEIDIYIPDRNLGIEYNGIYWHGEQFLRERGIPLSEIKKIHQSKTLEAQEAGIRLIHIFEDLWLRKKLILQSIIRLALGKPERIIQGRNCVVKEIDNQIAVEFLLKNHLYEKRYAEVNLGLYHGNELVACMTFGHSRLNKNHSWELIRYAPVLNTSIIGGAEKLWKHFLEAYRPYNVICYADASLFTGSLYEKLGFEKKGLSEPCNWYIINGKRYHRSTFTKSRLEQKGLLIDEKLSAHENMILMGHECFWDCGSWVLTWSHQQS